MTDLEPPEREYALAQVDELGVVETGFFPGLGVLVEERADSIGADVRSSLDRRDGCRLECPLGVPVRCHRIGIASIEGLDLPSHDLDGLPRHQDRDGIGPKNITTRRSRPSSPSSQTSMPSAIADPSWSVI